MGGDNDNKYVNVKLYSPIQGRLVGGRCRREVVAGWDLDTCEKV